MNTQFDTQLNVPHTLSSTTLYTTPPVSSQPSGPSTEGTRLSALASTFKPSDVVSQGNVSVWPSTSGSGGSAIDHVIAALLAQQIPPLSKFSGEVLDGEGECFSDRKEQFELVAGACYWTDQSKLVNLVTRLRGQAYSYYRSCTSEQRSSYPLLVKALEDRFTPVRIQAVQSSRFHERKQSPTESVDSYAQDLRKLYQKAYPSTRQGSREVEAMGRSVLAYQFIAGLLPHLKAKIAGQEGTFEELLTKTRFEEARHRDIVEAAGVGNRQSTTNLTMGTGRNPLVYRKSNPPQSTPRSVVGRQPEPLRCYHCGGTNHLRRDCPLRGRSAPLEAAANKTVNNGVQNRSGSTGVNSNRSGSTVMTPNPGKKVAMLTADKETEGSDISESSEIEAAVNQATATLHGIKPENANSCSRLGPTPTSEVNLEGSPAKAFLDSGSPVSIVSLEFFIKACVQNRKTGESPAEWGEKVKQRFRKPTVLLKNYGGGELNIVGEVECCLTRSNYTVKALLQVQKGAPVDLLLGTDTLVFLFYRRRVMGAQWNS